MANAKKVNAMEIVAKMVKEIDLKNSKFILEDYWILEEIDSLQRSLDKNDELLIDYYTNKIKEMIAEFDEMYLCPSNVEIGQGVTKILYSDRKAFTIIKTTAQSITIQRDKATRTFQPEFDGMHCINNDDQSYEYESDPEGEIETYRWSKKNGRYTNKSTWLIKGRKEKFDLNF